MKHIYMLEYKNQTRFEEVICDSFMESVKRILIMIEIMGLSDWRVVGNETIDEGEEK